MIVLRSVSKSFGRWRFKNNVLINIDAQFDPKRHYVIFGQSGSGKSTLLRVLCGLQTPSEGVIHRYSSVSLPVGTGPILAGGHSPRHLAKLYAQLYNANTKEVIGFVRDFGELADVMDASMEELSPAIRSRLAYALGYGIPADTYLLDSMIGSGTKAFRKKCERAYENRRSDHGTIFVTRNIRGARDFGESGAILHNGRLLMYSSIDDAIEVFKALELHSRRGTFEFAQSLVRSNRFEEAQEFLRDYIVKYPDDGDGYQLLADIALRLGNLDLAGSTAEIIIEREFDVDEAYYILARVAERQRRFTAAIEAAEEFLTRQPTHEDARRLLARCYEGAKRVSDAAVVWRNIAPQNLRDLDLRSSIRLEIKLKNWEEALAKLEIALERRSNDVQLLDMRVQVLVASGKQSDFEEAVVRLAVVDLDRALARTAQMRANLGWRNVINLMRSFQELDLEAHAESRGYIILLGHLEKEARMALKEGRHSEAEDIKSFIQVLSKGRLVQPRLSVLTDAPSR